jgi:superfamily II DNA/RNA helicase
VAHNLGLRTIVVAPPHLVPQWEEYRGDFNYNARVFSSGKTAEPLAYFKEKYKSGSPWLIIIDEAHKYRNEYTADYDNLHNLCRGNKVMLLTATPFNNRPADIYAMVKFFQLPLKSTLKHIDNLSLRFNALILKDSELRKKQRGKEIDAVSLKQEVDLIGAEIRHIISPVVIRRSRLDLCKIDVYRKDLEKQNICFAETGDPELMEYDLGALKERYLAALRQISPDVETDETLPHYQAARYNAVHYVKEQYKEKLKQNVEKAGIDYNLFIGIQRNLAKFMRRLLVQRFESSKKAFELSLGRMIAASKNILAWIDKRGAVPIFKEGALPDIESYFHDRGSESDDNLFNEELADAFFDEALHKLEDKGLFELDVEYFDGSFVEDIKSDIQVLEDIQEDWFGENKNTADPKREHFAEILRKQIKNDPERKIVVFSSYADTVDDLYENLKTSGIRVFKYTSKDGNKKNKETIKRNFDAGKKEQDDDYDVLAATDAISEGCNLHRAGTIFNYDIPYNPTRVIQRVGRINRINKKVFDRLYIYNYFPTSIGETETHTKEISTLKMAMINAIFGEDTKALTKDIELKSFFAEQYNKMLSMSETESWETRYRNILEGAKNTPEYKTACTIPRRARIGRTADKPRKGVLLFGRKKEMCVFKTAKDVLNSETLSDQEAIKLFEAAISEEPRGVSEGFDAVYQRVKQSLFTRDAGEKIEKKKRDVLEKIDAIAKSGKLSDDYDLNALRYAAEIDALSGYMMRFIRNLAPKDYAALPDTIGEDFLDRARNMARDIDGGKESIIISEELQ